MSFSRYVYYCALSGGWGAFFGWALIELTGYGGSSSLIGVGLLGGVLGAMICGALAVFTTLLNGSLNQIPRKVGLTFLGGFVGGGVAILVAQLLFQLGAPRFLSWMLMGIGIGVVEGCFERSPTKLRNGLVGGALGGMIGGLLFDPIANVVGSDVSSRAVGFVIIGLLIGALIGLVQVILKEAWLVVVDGYRPGRQLILSSPVTIVGRGDHLPLPFLGIANAQIEIEHFMIVRQSSGEYFLEDNHSRLGTFLNGQRISAPSRLKHMDRIRFGPNHIDFHENRGIDNGSPSTGTQTTTATSAPRVPTPPPPPPPRKKRDTSTSSSGQHVSPVSKEDSSIPSPQPAQNVKQDQGLRSPASTVPSQSSPVHPSSPTKPESRAGGPKPPPPPRRRQSPPQN